MRDVTFGVTKPPPQLDGLEARMAAIEERVRLLEDATREIIDRFQGAPDA